MSEHDDDILQTIPEPDAEPTAAERAHAKSFADLVEKSFDPEAKAPAAMSADDRALLEMATMIRAVSGRIELGTAQRRSLVDDVLRQAVGEAPRAVSKPAAAVIALDSRRAKKWVPWSIAGASAAIAAAAVAMLVLRQPQRVTVVQVVEPPPPAEWTSRTADALVGPIAKERAAAADSRIDAIFDDRLDGYRERRLTSAGRERRLTSRGGRP